jgi:dihydroorotate dehydrogenase
VSGWRAAAYALARPLLFRFDPERIHQLTLNALRIAGENRIGRAALRVASGAPPRGRPWVELAGVRFRNRVGVGAGFDKDALALRGWAALGLGFAEVGTITPFAQAGNQRPRLFRLVRDEALVNRMGFNNAGAVALARNVMLARRHLPRGFAVGINIGRGHATETGSAAADYLAAYRAIAPVADYVAINVSSPNTARLRELQDAAWLTDLLGGLADASSDLHRPPILVKLAPDLGPPELDGLLEAIGAHAAGVILANTSLGRGGLQSPHAAEDGGLSGAPLLGGTLAAVDRARRLLGPAPLIVASGGIRAATDVDAAYAAGADLVQLWTGLVYRGPGLIGEAVRVPFRRGAGTDADRDPRTLAATPA